MKNTTRIIYVYDTLCGWCNVARPEIATLHTRVKTQIPFVLLHRRLFTNSHVPTIDEAFLDKVRHVGWTVGPAMTGQKFSGKYLDLLTSDNFKNESSLSSLACAAASRLLSESDAFEYAEQLQGLVFDKGLNPNQFATLNLPALELKIDEAIFTDAVKDPHTQQEAISVAKQALEIQNRLSTPGVPVLALEVNNDLIALDPYRYRKSISIVEELTG